MAAPKPVIVLTDDLARRLGQRRTRKLAAVLHSEQECIMPERRTAQELDDRPAREQAPLDEIEVPPPGPGYYVTDGYPHRETDPKNWRRLDEDPVDVED